MTIAHPGRPRCGAVIFDMDGLLIDSEPFWRRVEIAVFERAGFDIRPLIGRGNTMGMRVDTVVAMFRSELGVIDPSAEALVEEIVAGMVDAITNEAVLMPGAIEALDACATADLPLALASGSLSSVIDAVVDRFALRDRFGAICSAEHEEHGKPHPALFLRAARDIGVAPSACVVLEDSVNGCIAGKAAGMAVIAVPDHRFVGDPRYSIADLVLESLTELDGPEASALLGLVLASSAG